MQTDFNGRKKNMWFWGFLFVCDLFIPILMIVVGYMIWKHSPKKINRMIGYRTARSMKNIDTWKFAHDYCGRLWWKIGWFMLIPSMVIHLPFYHSSEKMVGIVGTIVCTIQCVILIVSVFLTERALRRTFTEAGIRR